MDIITLIKQFPAGWTRPLCMGILNITPDSFHDGGQYLDVPVALSRVQALLDNGADLIDIGGMSSRPGHSLVAAAEEIERISPVLEQYGQQACFSVDTDKYAVAAAALRLGARLINDCSGNPNSPMFALAAEQQVPIVIMHRQGQQGQHQDIAAEVEEFFCRAMQAGKAAGLQPWQFILDPGLGFNKSYAENLAVLNAMQRFALLGQPLLLGYSHKRFVAALSGEQPGNAMWGNAALAAFSVHCGAHLVRVHEPEQFVPVYRATSKLHAELVAMDTAARGRLLAD